MDKKFAICMLCFNKPDTELSSCIFKLTDGLNPSNVNKHFIGQHTPDDAPEFFKLSNATKKKTADTGTITSLFNAQSSTQAFTGFYNQCHKFFNRSNISFRLANSQDFVDLTNYIVTNAQHLKTDGDRLKIGPYKFNELAKNKFKTMTYVIGELIQLTREYYTNEIGKPVPFLTVAHDIWDSRNSEVLGVSIFFIFPLTFELLSLPIALPRVTSKKAACVSAIVENHLQR
jgi:hypothetical protein